MSQIDNNLSGQCYSLGGHDSYRIELFMNGPIEKFYIVTHLPTGDISCETDKFIREIIKKP